MVAEQQVLGEMPPRTTGEALTEGSRESTRKLTVSGLSHCFHQIGSKNGVVKTLEDIDMDVKPHTFTALVGPSGCGKTTLLNLIAGLEEVQHGNLLIDQKPPRTGRSDVAYML